MIVAKSKSKPASAARGVGYDAMVDWDKRLAREVPFLQRAFAEAGGVHRVIDVGAGTGQHAIALVRSGYDVVGVDPGAEMLERARANAAAAGAHVRFVEGGFGDLVTLGVGPADAAICTGNALPHVAGLAGLDAALADLAAVIRPGGVLVLHLLNHARLLEKRPRFLGPVVRDLPGGDTLVFLRLFEYDPPQAPERIWIEFVTSAKDDASAEAGDADLGWSVTANRSAHTVMPLPVLRAALERAGFGGVKVFGDHGGKVFEPDADESVVLTASRDRRSGTA